MSRLESSYRYDRSKYRILKINKGYRISYRVEKRYKFLFWRWWGCMFQALFFDHWLDKEFDSLQEAEQALERRLEGYQTEIC